MVDMHGNSAKTLRQNLLQQRTMFAAEQDYAQIQARLIDHLNELLSEQGDSWQSIALYWPIQDEIDLRSTLVAWAKKAPNRTLSLPFARPDKHPIGIGNFSGGCLALIRLGQTWLFQLFCIAI